MITLRVKTNERFYREVQYKDSNDLSIPISGYNIDLGIKSINGSTIATLSVGSGITLTNPNEGMFTIQVDDISNWAIGLAKADIIITNTFGDIVASETFNINIIQGITNV